MYLKNVNGFLHYNFEELIYLRRPNLKRNELIYSLYFEDKLTVSEISKTVDLSISQISRVLSKSPLYHQEKENRKEEYQQKHKEQAKEIMRNKRRKKKLEEQEILDNMHNQASIELSYFSPISKVALRKNCSSAYEYDSAQKNYKLKDDCVYSTDMPSKITY